jgi:hypothetical protein
MAPSFLLIFVLSVDEPLNAEVGSLISYAPAHARGVIRQGRELQTYRDRSRRSAIKMKA